MCFDLPSVFYSLSQTTCCALHTLAHTRTHTYTRVHSEIFLLSKCGTSLGKEKQCIDRSLFFFFFWIHDIDDDSGGGDGDGGTLMFSVFFFFKYRFYGFQSKIESGQLHALLFIQQRKLLLLLLSPTKQAGKKHKHTK